MKNIKKIVRILCILSIMVSMLAVPEQVIDFYPI